MTMELQQKLKAAAAQIRKDVIEMTYRAGRKGGHLGGALSMCEIMLFCMRTSCGRMHRIRNGRDAIGSFSAKDMARLHSMPRFP